VISDDQNGPDGGGSPRRLAVRLIPDAERQVRGGHPWVFDSSVRSVRVTGTDTDEEPRAGDLAVVFDQRRRFVAIGLWDPDSPIRIRILHRGAPRQIDDDWFRDTVAAAARRREPLTLSGSTTGYRVVNGENDGLPGVVIDRYEGTAVLKLYSGAWWAHLEQLVEAIVAALGSERVVLRLARVVQRAAPAGAPGDGATLHGPAPTGPLVFLENGLRVEADVVAGQKTGWFLDQRDNRARVRDLCAGAQVLDVFCAGGGFTLHAAAGGAAGVHSVDLSPGAVAATGRNLALNSDRAEVASCAHRTTTGDAAEVMAALRTRGERYDVVVVDPPSFASKQQQVPGALRAYGRLTQLAVGLLRPGGWLVQASCSARVPSGEFVDAVHAAARSAGERLVDAEVTGHPLDHPIGFEHGAYLKAVFARVGNTNGRR
jgi:23S rRNA (cytosine1962-C5)-methyltransferase